MTSYPPSHLFLVLAAMLAAAKLLAHLAVRIGQPPVLGELLAGVLLGQSLLGVVPADGAGAASVAILAELGVVLLLFEIGLETSLKEMSRVGVASLAVAVVGVVVPFGLGFLYWQYAPHPLVASSGSLTATAIFVGATLTATSVGITARVFFDLGRMHTREARIVLGAAVIDDVLGLIILAVVSALAAGTALSVGGVTRISAIAVGFLVAVVAVGSFVVRRLFTVIERMQVKHALLAFAIVLMLGLAALASEAGSALIVGAFAAGIVVAGTSQHAEIDRGVRPLVGIFAPVFFVSIGSQVDLGLFNPFRPGAPGVLMIALVLTVLAVAGKVVAGWAVPWEKFDRLVVGVGMIPRGEVGLIFAGIGRQSGLLGVEVFSAVLLMVMATTFAAPIGLKAVFGRGDPP